MLLKWLITSRSNILGRLPELFEFVGVQPLTSDEQTEREQIIQLLEEQQKKSSKSLNSMTQGSVRVFCEKRCFQEELDLPRLEHSLDCDIEYASQASIIYCQSLVFAGEPLDFVYGQYQEHFAFVNKFKQSFFILYIKIIQEVVISLVDEAHSDDRIDLDDAIEELVVTY